MLENNVGLFAIAHALHKLLGQNNHLVRRQFVFGRRVEREVDNRLLNVGIQVCIVFEGFGALVDMELAAGTLRNALRSEQFTVACFDFNVVVGQHAVYVAAIIDGRDHRLFGILCSDFMLLLPGAKLPDQGYHLLYQLLQFLRFSRQFVEESQRFLLPVNGVNRLHALVIVVSYRPELGIKLGQADVKIERVFVLRDDRKVSAEYPRPDKIGGVAGLCSAEHSQEFFIFLVVQGDVIAMYSRIGQHDIAGLISCLMSFSHKTTF